MGKSKKDKKEASMIEDMTGIPSEYVWAILAVLCILIVVGCLYFFKIWPFSPEATTDAPAGAGTGAGAGAGAGTGAGAPPNFPTALGFDQGMQKATGGGVRIFKKR